MRFEQKAVLGGLTLCIFLVGLITGCSINGNVASPYVQDVVQQEPILWFLSPVGDKLLYNTTSSRGQAIVRVLTTDQELAVKGCSLFSWLDNEHIYCYDFYDGDYEPFIVAVDVSSNADDFQKSLIKEITAEQVDLDKLLEQAKVIYRLSASTQPDMLLILDTENASQYYHVTGVNNLDQVLENHTYETISLSGRSTRRSGKVYSPNGRYYYLLQKNLGIYDAITNQLLAEFKPPPKYISWFRFGGFSPNKTEGWAADNSGVYFQISHRSGFGPPLPIRPIQKLCVPGASGCPTAN
ncbi:hypothetical protein D6779_10620 [Candidatus Parcubacteria bacterium]|nr:MAG: hypothetical protein D6779_10620 [Candidatus Parcubacteria bacterium]